VNDREAWISRTMLELADSRGVHEPAYLQRLIDKVSELVAPAEAGLLVTTPTGSLVSPAASTSRMHELLAIESRFKEGPCTTCHGTGQSLPPQDLDQVDLRWPRFGPAARQFGFGTVSAVPVRRDSELLGAVCVLDFSDGSAVELDLVAAVVEVAAIGLLHQQALRHSQRRTDQLQHALHSRVIIEQAKGVVAARREITPDAAFESLRSHARRHGRRLRDVADDVIAGRVSDRDIDPN
jgi:GAF domain-containing protein